MGFLKKITEFFKNWFDKFSLWLNDLSGEEKKRLVIYCTIGFSVLLTLSVVITLISAPKEKIPAELQRTRLNAAIPAEELFLPDEPDFLPGVLLERERRTSWSEHDAAEYWQNPLVSGEEQWRENIETFIDEYLERIP